MHNNPHIKQAAGNVALMHPDDAKRRGVVQGDVIEIRSDQGEVSVKVNLTKDIAPGVIAVPHGWGHQDSNMSRAASLPGANINEVVPGGPENMEPVSGQAIMLGHFVTVEKVGKILKNIPFFIDSAQTVGCIEVDVSKINCDFMSFNGSKWLCGPMGTGLFYCSRNSSNSLTPSTIGGE